MCHIDTPTNICDCDATSISMMPSHRDGATHVRIRHVFFLKTTMLLERTFGLDFGKSVQKVDICTAIFLTPLCMGAQSEIHTREYNKMQCTPNTTDDKQLTGFKNAGSFSSVAMYNGTFVCKNSSFRDSSVCYVAHRQRWQCVGEDCFDGQMSNVLVLDTHS
jgi:hypothetical protein